MRVTAVRVLLPLALLAPGTAVAQGRRPLTKADLIQMLTASNRTRPQIAAVIERNCITFQPSNRDLAELRVAGADSVVFGAIAKCARVPQPILLVVPHQVLATAGTEIPIRVQVRRGDRPVPNITIRLRGATAIPGGSSQEPGAVTDARGVARPRLLAGLQAGTYPIDVIAEEGAGRTATVQLKVSSPGGVMAAVRPSVLRLHQGSRTGAAVQVAVQDRSGRTVPGVALELEGVTAQIDTGLRAVTDPRGVATFAIPPGAVHRGGRVGVFYAGTRLAMLDVQLENVVLSSFRTQFRSGTDQRGAVHTTLRRPLVFEVRDTTGLRVTDYPVHFAVVNGSVAPTDARTDTSGTVRVVATLGQQAGPVVVTATAGQVRKEASLYATPGPAVELVVQRGGQPLDSVLTITSRDSVGLRVVVRDAFGNDALLEGLQVSVSGRAGAVALRSLRGGGPPGAVVLDPRRGGAAELAVRASGLARTIPITVDLPVHASEWVFAARAGGAAFSYGYQPTSSTVDGRPGFRAELLGGRRVGPPGLRVEGGLGLGVLRASATSGANLAVPLIQGLVRGEYALLREGGVIPVVTAGGGIYRLKSTDNANMVYHTSLFWLVGAGIDWAIGPQLTGEARLERQQLYEATSSITGADGTVGALTILEVGVRYSP